MAASSPNCPGILPLRLVAQRLSEGEAFQRAGRQMFDGAAWASATGRPIVLTTRTSTDVTKVHARLNSGSGRLRTLPNVGANGFRQGPFTGEAAVVGVAAGNVRSTGLSCPQ